MSEPHRLLPAVPAVPHRPASAGPSRVVRRAAPLGAPAHGVADMAVGAQLMEVVRTSRLREEVLRRPHLADWVSRLRQLGR